MKRRALAAWWFAGTAFVVAAFGWTSPAAFAVSPRDQGWWTTTNPLPTPPDVPDKGLLVQGGGGGTPTAFAAVLYELDGDTAGTLTLTVAPNSATTSATLQLCQLIQPIVHPDDGGPMSDAPAYNCAKQVTAAPANGSYKFDVSGLATDKVMAVAILPTGPVDRVVLTSPDANSLPTHPAPPDITTANPGDPADNSSAPVAAPPSYAGLDVPIGLSTPTGAAVAPAASTEPAASSAPAQPSDNSAPFIPAVTTGAPAATPLLVILFVIAGLAGAALWRRAGRSSAT